MQDRNTPPRISPVLLSKWLGQDHAPTPQQADVIGAPVGPLLVVAGAGAGKTETMAARVVWLVANGYCTPDEVLGLTFTRKAAQGLSARIRSRLAILAGIPTLRRLDPSGKLAQALHVITPTVSTYDSYAGQLVREYGLLLPVEPSARLVTETELFQIARTVVDNYTGELPVDQSASNVTATLLLLSQELDNHMVTAAQVREETDPLVALFEELPKAPRQRDALNATMSRWRDVQMRRMDFLPLVDELRNKLTQLGVVTFGQQMTMAASLASRVPKVGAGQRRRFRVVMLDEYQDTSHAQRVLLTSLFGGKDPSLTVTAVGDPMQSIYGWRGATAANLERFTTDFPLLKYTDSVAGADTSRHTVACGPAPKKELTVSWRNPADVLGLANSVAESVLGSVTKKNRAVQPLEPRPGAGSGDVRLAWFATEEEENDWIARHMAEAFRLKKKNDEPFSGAVLIRKRHQAAALAEALAAHGVPHEIVGVAGLTHVPEIADLIAVATMLVRPGDSVAALRILIGPMVNLGAGDILALNARVRNLAARAIVRDDDSIAGSDFAVPGAGEEDTADAAFRRLKEEIFAATADFTDTHVGLADAIADPGEAERYSEEGYRRITDLGAKLRHLRTRYLGHGVAETFAGIETVLGIRTEVLSRRNPREPGASGTAHLDKFAAYAEDFDQIPGATLASFLDWLALADEKEDGLEPGAVTTAPDKVQILTVHKAKGLEWDTVAVAHADRRTYTDAFSTHVRNNTWVTDITQVPSTLRGDAAHEGDSVGSPVLDVTEVSNRKELEETITEHIRDFRRGIEEEATRLFYVALTRSGGQLFISGSALSPGSSTETGPVTHFDKLLELYPGLVEYRYTGAVAKTGTPVDASVSLDDSLIGDSAAAAVTDEKAVVLARLEEKFLPDGQTLRHGVFPMAHLGERDEAVRAGAARVRDACTRRPPAPQETEDTFLWEKDVTALIEEQSRLQSPTVTVALPTVLTASDVVALRKDPDSFARRLARPVPFKPDSYAKRGTAFHQWVEEHYGMTSLCDVDDLPGMGEANPSGEKLKELKRKFLASQWADRTPARIEQPFTVTVGGLVLVGRMDAIFHEGDDPATGWTIIDWKTGAKPRGSAADHVALQLAVYRLAWAELLGRELGISVEETSIDAGFHYIGPNETVRPSKLPSKADIIRFVQESTKHHCSERLPQ